LTFLFVGLFGDEPKYEAYLSCSAIFSHFARTSRVSIKAMRLWKGKGKGKGKGKIIHGGGARRNKGKQR
jgi:hypothetical protein